jgi:hypothetical protein
MNNYPLYHSHGEFAGTIFLSDAEAPPREGRRAQHVTVTLTDAEMVRLNHTVKTSGASQETILRFGLDYFEEKAGK